MLTAVAEAMRILNERDMTRSTQQEPAPMTVHRLWIEHIRPWALERMDDVEKEVRRLALRTPEEIMADFLKTATDRQLLESIYKMLVKR